MSAEPKPIQPSEIRKGDLIRRELAPGHPAGYKSIEFVASSGLRLDDDEPDRFYLLDRPTPPVELPRGSHFGTLTWVNADGNSGGTLTAEWLIDANYAEALNFGRIDLARVRSFDRMTAVPTEAVDALRWSMGRGPDVAHEAAVDFLAAVDEANGDAS